MSKAKRTPQPDFQMVEMRVPRKNEYSPENMSGLLASLGSLPERSLLEKISRKKPVRIVFETAAVNQTIYFLLASPKNLMRHIEAQVLAAYPLCTFIPQKDYLNSWQIDKMELAYLSTSRPFYYPLKTWKEFKNIDPMASVLAVLSKSGPNDRTLIQILLAQAGNWQSEASQVIQKGIQIDKETTKAHPDAGQIKEKISKPGFKVIIRIVSNNIGLLNSLNGAYQSFTRGEGNALILRRPRPWQKKKLAEAIIRREFWLHPKNMILNIEEIATLHHLPNESINIPNIAWGRGVVSEAPDNLPVAMDANDEARKEINFFARTHFKNRDMIFGIKRRDRRQHIYIIGKSGTGKSWMISNMLINDMRRGEGVAVIDPHGDLVETILDYVPSNRINDVIYFNPADRERPVVINPLEVHGNQQAELVASGIVSIFKKLYGHSWGPRMEYILRNTLLTLTSLPDTTMADVIKTLTQQEFRETVVSKLKDQVLINYWRNEFDKMSDKLRVEAISPILNKVGQFVSSPLIRGIIGSPKSSVNLTQVMDQGKIFLANLSQGRLGEDNAALLGAMLVSKMQLAAMERVHQQEEERKDFFLYVDEFQNFATDSFIKILAEARKYRLCLTLANQYIGQISPDVTRAIFGNVGTLISFAVGAHDAESISREFGGRFTPDELVGMSNYKIIVKLQVDKQTTIPFFANTLPLPENKNKNREKVIQASRERWGKNRAEPKTNRPAE